MAWGTWDKDEAKAAEAEASVEIKRFKTEMSPEQLLGAQILVKWLSSWTAGEDAKKAHPVSWKALGHVLQEVFNR